MHFCEVGGGVVAALVLEHKGLVLDRLLFLRNLSLNVLLLREKRD